jgi:hypothetical protein
MRATKFRFWFVAHGKSRESWLKLKPTSQTLIQSFHIDRLKLSHYLDDTVACDARELCFYAAENV